MIALPIIAAACAEEAGIEVPRNPDEWNTPENKEKYLRFWVYCTLQLGAPMPHASAHWENAQVVAGLPLERLTTMTVGDFQEAGFQIGYSK